MSTWILILWVIIQYWLIVPALVVGSFFSLLLCPFDGPPSLCFCCCCCLLLLLLLLLSTSLLSGAQRCCRFILYSISHPSPQSAIFSKVSWFLLLKNGNRNSYLLATGVMLLLGPFSWQNKDIDVCVLTIICTYIYKYFYRYSLVSMLSWTWTHVQSTEYRMGHSNPVPCGSF